MQFKQIKQFFFFPNHSCQLKLNPRAWFEKSYPVGPILVHDLFPSKSPKLYRNFDGYFVEGFWSKKFLPRRTPFTFAAAPSVTLKSP